MTLCERSVTSFLDELASKSPAPGGGSVAALSLSLGAALARMVGELSMGKKRFLELAPSVQLAFMAAHERMSQTLEKAKTWIEDDKLAFDQVMAAFALPKTTETDIASRKLAIRDATHKAIFVPRQVANACLAALLDMASIIQGANSNTLSDQAVAVRMMQTSAQSAIDNMLANKASLGDEAEAQLLLQETHHLKELLEERSLDLLSRLEAKLKK
jgi:formiminotetrahydrofolate cyclodeaminase